MPRTDLKTRDEAVDYLDKYLRKTGAPKAVIKAWEIVRYQPWLITVPRYFELDPERVQLGGDFEGDEDTHGE